MNLRKHLNVSRAVTGDFGGNAHMTWASPTLSRSIQGTGTFVRRQVWLWPLMGVILLSLIGLGVHSSIETTMRHSLASELQTLRNVEVAMLRTWLSSQERNAESMANVKEVRELTTYLLRAQTPQIETDEADEPDVISSISSVEEAQQRLASRLAPFLTSHSYVGYLLCDRTQGILATSEQELTGSGELAEYADWLNKAIDGHLTVSRPFLSIAALPDETGRIRTGVPTMFVAAPVRDDNLQVVGALALRIRPQNEFTRILQLGQIGETGETYAFDADGTMLSKSRFDNELILLGLLPDQQNSSSLLHIQVRDPLGDVTTGYRPNVRRHELPLTRMAETAKTANTGFNVEGYRGYRGVPVVGAWTWLNEYNFGVATEADMAEAFRPLTILKRAFWGLMALLMLSSAAIFAFSLAVARLQRQARQAAIEAKQLGQYKLEDKLGEGAMGIVYRGRHAMLRRPTAIKLIDADKVSEISIERFEREVQITSQLNHPNTIAIYDFGRTPEGVFYYAMEYLNGIDLQQLVERYGAQNPARVNYVLQQICGSLYEAHTHGLVHRDIKPANVMLNRRGAQSDVIKVLDFGLVKARDQGSTRVHGLAGTPLYMSPEAIQFPESVDACSDIYAVGAVGYFLLTGQPVFQADSMGALCQLHIAQAPRPPSELVNNIPEDLENIILACLEKDRSVRPQTAREVIRALAACANVTDWNTDIAERWWSRHGRDSGMNSSLVPEAIERLSGDSDSGDDSNSGNDSSSVIASVKLSALGATLDHN